MGWLSLGLVAGCEQKGSSKAAGSAKASGSAAGKDSEKAKLALLDCRHCRWQRPRILVTT